MYAIFFCLLLLFVSFAKINPEPVPQPLKLQNLVPTEEKELMGIKTHHGSPVKIDKHTLITGNLKLKRRKSGQEFGQGEEGPERIYSPIPPEVAEHVRSFKINMTECLKEVQKLDKRPVKRLSPSRESPVHGECLIACVLKRNQVLHEGKVVKANLLGLIGKFYSKDSKLMKRLEQGVDHCIESVPKQADECTTAGHLNECTNKLMTSNKLAISVNYK